MSKHYSHELPEVSRDVFAVHTPGNSTRQYQDYLQYDGRRWIYSLTNLPITGIVNCWYDTEAEAQS